MTGGFFAVFDDIAALLDDAASMSKVATKKTVGILGDDLAVSAEQASGFASSRELPVLWAITKGSFKNKMIILPFAFLLSAFLPWMIVPILMLGGIYLSYEGVEKIYEYFYHHKVVKVEKKPLKEEEILKLEKSKIKSAIVTDFVLSIEIIVMALGTVVGETLPIQIVAVSVVAVFATVGVYGTVALIVRMDDFGFKLIDMAKGVNKFYLYVGNMLVRGLPKVIKALTVIGTIAMLLVAGGIFIHNIEQLHVVVEFLPMIISDFVVGFVIGVIALSMQKLFSLAVSWR
jgi:predicted DNA repair protein MutK